MRCTDYAVVTPVRNEARYLSSTVESVAAQTLRPKLWVLVNDGSTDGTDEIVNKAASEHPWVKAIHRADRGFRKSGGGVVEAFYDGFGRLSESFPKWEFLVKLDGDLRFAPDYFKACLSKFENDSRLGIGGGMVCEDKDGQWLEESQGDPAFHVRGATKIYRRACWEAIGGLLQAPGWDTLDELKANMLGWSTYTFRDLKLLQLKSTGTADGTWRNWVKNGRANYITGYHPAFMLAKCGRRIIRPPFMVAGAGLFIGFLGGYLRRLKQVDDPELIKYLRTQQLNRLFGRRSLWS